MIKLLKNKEIKIYLLLQVLASIIACGVCFYIDYRAGIATTVLAVLLIIIYFISTYIRYKNIISIAGEIDKLLHGDYSFSIEDYSEGELSILNSEIYKMTVRLREQQQKLMNDKVFLADSLADISHQIRTPLTSINLIVQFLNEPELSYDRRKKLVRDLHRLMHRIEWHITALLKISKLDAGTISFNQEQISMEALLEKACSPLLIPIELRGQELAVKADGEFVGDIAWTCEAIGNIVKNCMEHTPEGGKLEIEAKENAIYTEIIIKDNGSGIAKEDMPHIFERFYRGTNSNDNSYGIGLALARMIINAQNGTVRAENRKSSGAKFSIRFYKGTV